MDVCVKPSSPPIPLYKSKGRGNWNYPEDPYDQPRTVREFHGRQIKTGTLGP